jgi:hypothetical protein
MNATPIPEPPSAVSTGAAAPPTAAPPTAPDDAADAARALAAVRERQDDAISAALVPGWFWPTIGLLALGFFAAIESERPFWVITGSIIYAVGLGAIIGHLLITRRFQLRNDLLGAHGAIAIVTFALVLTGVGLGLGVCLEAAGLARPVTTTGVAFAAGMTLGGPLLMRYLVGVMRSRAAAR